MQIKYIGKDGDNSYLLCGEKTAAAECMKKENAEFHISRIKENLAGAELDYIILNSVSPYNAGTVSALTEQFKGAKIVASVAGIKNLREMLNRDFDYILAKDNDVLDLGGCSLLFKILPNLPWTDSMASYCPEEKTLFCGSIFNAENGYYEKYILPFSDYAQNASKRLSELEINAVLPAFGDKINDISPFLKLYGQPAERSDSAAVFYASIFGNTREMAETVCGVLNKRGISTRLFDVYASGEAELKKAMDTCAGFAVGTNTVNRNADRKIWSLISSIDMISGKHKPYIIFGSCGWSGEGIYCAEKLLRSLGMRQSAKPAAARFTMSDTERAELCAAAEKLADDILNQLGGK